MALNLLLLAVGAGTAAAAAAPHGLRVDHLPGASGLTLGVGVAPILSWRLPEDGGIRGFTQAAFQISLIVASSDEVLWGSGKVLSTEPEVRAGVALRHGSEYEWRVRVWMNRGTPTHSNSIYALADETGDGAAPSDWSEYHRFETAADASAWGPGGTGWIGGGNMFRSDLNVPAGKKVKSARAYVSALGAFDFYINGAKVGDHVMDPGQTVTTERVLFVPFDITDLLKSGENAIGATVGTAKYGYLDIWCNSTAHGEQFGNPGGACMALMARVVVNMTDGTSVVVGSDTSWKVRDGPHSSLPRGRFRQPHGAGPSL
jgi:alpha-L-rhamnosidase